MAAMPKDTRSDSLSSSSTQAPSFDEHEKAGTLCSGLDERDLAKDIEMDGLLAGDHEPKSLDGASNETRRTSLSSIMWIAVNTLATIGIVFTNKAIFSDPSLKLIQLSFAAFHFFVTWLTLYVLSRPRFAFFVPRRIAFREIVPLAVAMSLNVILPNFSLAFSSVTFYQVARILLTPTVAAMNYFIYSATLPRNAIYALIPACAGVGMVSYYDSLPTANANVQTTSTLGVFFAFTGIFASSLYTVWISSYHKKFQMNSMQLLFNQAPISAFLLLYVIPFVDTFPVWREVPGQRWVMIMMSGFFACLINISQFFIIAQTGRVSSTVVGHLKTCSIVALRWMTSGRGVGDKSVIGVIIAVGGIVSYSTVMINHQNRGGRAG